MRNQWATVISIFRWKGRYVLGHQFCKIVQQRTTENKTHVNN